MLKFEWNVTLYKNEQCIPMKKIMVELTDSYISIKRSRKYFVIFKVWTHAMIKKQKKLKSDAFHLLMNTSKELQITKKKESISFSNELFNHVVSIYQ